MTLPHHFQKRLSLPVIAAPLFLASGPKLVLACCRAGIIGTLPAKNQRTLAGFEEWLNEICDGLASIERETGFPPAPFGVNLIVHQTNKNLKKELDLCVKYRVPLIITSLGAVSRVVDKVHNYGGIVFHDVISSRHAQKAAEAGVDGLIAVAAGAGGHTGLANPFALVNEIRDFFDKTVLLAGALSTGADIAAALTMGADLAYLGTRFLATKEGLSEQNYKKMIVESNLTDIKSTAAVSGINANFLQKSLHRAGIDINEPIRHSILDIDKDLAEAFTEKSDTYKPWRDIWSAGQGVGSINDIPSVEQLVSRLRDQYHSAIKSQQIKKSRLISRPK